MKSEISDSKFWRWLRVRQLERNIRASAAQSESPNEIIVTTSCGPSSAGVDSTVTFSTPEKKEGKLFSMAEREAKRGKGERTHK